MLKFACFACIPSVFLSDRQVIPQCSNCPLVCVNICLMARWQLLITIVSMSPYACLKGDAEAAEISEIDIEINELHCLGIHRLSSPTCGR